MSKTIERMRAEQAGILKALNDLNRISAPQETIDGVTRMVSAARVSTALVLSEFLGIPLDDVVAVMLPFLEQDQLIIIEEKEIIRIDLPAICELLQKNECAFWQRVYGLLIAIGVPREPISMQHLGSIHDSVAWNGDGSLQADLDGTMEHPATYPGLWCKDKIQRLKELNEGLAGDTRDKDAFEKSYDDADGKES